MVFGLYLVKQGVITANQFVMALESQLLSRPQVGALAIETRKTRTREAFQVLRSQADQPHRKFGELAVEADMLTPEELSGLLYQQSVRVKPITEILVEIGCVESQQVDQLMHVYHQENQPLHPPTNWPLPTAFAERLSSSSLQPQRSAGATPFSDATIPPAGDVQRGELV